MESALNGCTQKMPGEFAKSDEWWSGISAPNPRAGHYRFCRCGERLLSFQGDCENIMIWSIPNPLAYWHCGPEKPRWTVGKW